MLSPLIMQFQLKTLQFAIHGGCVILFYGFLHGENLGAQCFGTETDFDDIALFHVG